MSGEIRRDLVASLNVVQISEMLLEIFHRPNEISVKVAFLLAPVQARKELTRIASAAPSRFIAIDGKTLRHSFDAFADRKAGPEG